MAKSQLQDEIGQRRLPPSSRAAPWLCFQHGKDRKFQTFYNLFDPLSNSYKKKIIPELANRTFWQKGSNLGWLIIVCDDDTETKENYGNCYLWNPASLKTIMLPNILRCLHQKSFFGAHYVKDCVLSFGGGGGGDGVEGCSNSSFCSDDNSADWMVYLLLNDNDDAEEDDAKPDILLYCHPGEKEWRKHEFVGVDPGTLTSVLYFNGKVFVMCTEDNVHLEIRHDSNKEALVVSDLIRVRDNFERGSVAGLLEYGCVEPSWLESFGEVYRIDRYYVPRYVHVNFVTQIVISKLDFSSMAWEEVKSLDDYVFFLSACQQHSCLASDLGFSKGCVYYTQAKDMGVYRYTLEDNSILLSVPCPGISSPWLPADWLMITTTQDTRTADRILDKDEGVDKAAQATEYRADIVKYDGKEDTEEVGLEFMLYDDIVRLISDFLHPVDYIHLRAVNKNYRSIISPRRSFSTRRTLQTTDLSPWLVFPENDQDVYSFVNPMHNNESYLINIPELLHGSRIRFSKGGWLLMSKGKTLFFYNPFTRSTIKLPNLPDEVWFNFSGISFSSLPTSSDCVVFGISQQAGSNASGIFVFFIKRGVDHWTSDRFACSYSRPNRKAMRFECDFNNPVFYRGAFYCLDNNGILGVSTTERRNSWEVLANVTRPKCEYIYKTFLVECEGKLLSVLLGHSGKWVRIFRLNDDDTADMVWVEVNHLGRHMLCISNTSCISAIAPTGRQMENKIYFGRSHNEGILYYSLDTGMYHSVGSTSHSAKDYRDSKEYLNCSWIEPNWSEISFRYLSWRNV